MKPPKRGHRTNAKGRSVGDGPYVRLDRWQLHSQAYRSLEAPARALLIEIKDLYNGRNNGELFMSVREAGRRINMSKNSGAKYLKELKDKGFIRPSKQGFFSTKFEARRGNATSWVLTEHAYANGLATKDFMHWHEPNGQDPVGASRTSLGSLSVSPNDGPSTVPSSA